MYTVVVRTNIIGQIFYTLKPTRRKILKGVTEIKAHMGVNNNNFSFNLKLFYSDSKKRKNYKKYSRFLYCTIFVQKIAGYFIEIPVSR